MQAAAPTGRPHSSEVRFAGGGDQPAKGVEKPPAARNGLSRTEKLADLHSRSERGHRLRKHGRCLPILQPSGRIRGMANRAIALPLSLMAFLVVGCAQTRRYNVQVS